MAVHQKGKFTLRHSGRKKSKLGDAVSTDDRDIQAYCQGDRGAFDAIARRYWDEVYGYFFRRVGDSCLAEECLNDTFLKVAQSAQNYQSQGSFRGWLYRIAHNVMLDSLRRRACRPDHKSEEFDAGIHGFDASVQGQPDTQLLHVEAVKKMNDMLNAVSEIKRQAFVLFHLQGCSVIEVSAALDLEIGSVRTYVSQVRRLLILALKEP